MMKQIGTRIFLGAMTAAIFADAALAQRTSPPGVSIPEPSPIAIMVVGLAAAAYFVRSKKRS